MIGASTESELVTACFRGNGEALPGTTEHEAAIEAGEDGIAVTFRPEWDTFRGSFRHGLAKPLLLHLGQGVRLGGTGLMEWDPVALVPLEMRRE